jgi:uncharacterized protein YneF (UPF0154 family)
MKELKQSLIVTVFMIAAFLCGKYFSEAREKQILTQNPPRVFIEQLKTKMNIAKNRNDIEIFLNGAKMTDDIKLDIRK